MLTSPRRRTLRRAVAVAIGSGLLALIAVPTAASADTSYGSWNLSAAVSGTSVTASVAIASTANVTAEMSGVCVRDAKNRNVDFPASWWKSITGSGRTITQTATFAAGTYRYWACLKVDSVWQNVGAAKTFTVASVAAQSSGSSSMPVGNLPGLTQTLAEDFKVSLPRGTFPGAYSSHWLSYDGFTDTSKVGDYDQDIISVHDGVLDIYLHTKNGRPLGAAPVPLVNGEWGGQTYGRFSVRMKADPIEGYGTGFLLWNDSGNWADGEIDFPESSLTDVAKGYNHCPGNPSKNCLVVDSDARYSDWHTYTIDWRPDRLSFLIDGEIVGTTTENIPDKPLHWVMQVATTGTKPATSATGNVLIDWATIYRYTP
ncbi:MAG: glycoside hydrolase family 16 protein [Burkholderiaceae bacterium]|nr:glycoside hydrolase family 16 protein [Microbacteriaceae bacterium]